MVSALERLRERKQANHRDIPICMDPELVAKRESVQNALGKLRARTSRVGGNQSNEALETEINDLEEALSDLDEQVRVASEWIRIKALAPDDYQELIDKHAPTREQIKEARKMHGPKAQLSWNTDTFPSAVLAASAYVLTVMTEDDKQVTDDNGHPVFDGTEDPFTAEFVKELQESGTWSGGEVGALVSAAISINESVANIGAAGNG